MKFKILIVLIPAFIFCKRLKAQTVLEGTWKGTSICQVKNSPCHDENVVYHISKDSGNNIFQINAAKIIDNKEDFMGTLIVFFDSLHSLVISIDTLRSDRWEFKMNKKEMKGTLIYKNQLYRIIDLKKEE